MLMCTLLRLYLEELGKTIIMEVQVILFLVTSIYMMGYSDSFGQVKCCVQSEI